jgi:hypothetical protein
MTEAQYSEIERACIMHYEGGIPWQEAIQKAADAAREGQRHLFFDEEPVNHDA